MGDERRYLSTAQVARALGISPATVKRWVDKGVLPAHRTAGGHRKILVADLRRLLQTGEQFPTLDWGKLDLATEAEQLPEPDQLAKQLVTALQQGDAHHARTLILGAHQAGLPVEELADFVIAPAMHRLGHAWEKEQIDVYQEHRGTQICTAALHELKPLLEERADLNPPLAIGGGPEGDHYSLASLLAQLVLLEAGWRVINIGPNTPLASICKAIDELHPRLLWLSASYLAEPRKFLDEYAKLYEAAEQAGVAVAVGGQALTECVRAGMSYTHFGDGLRHLAAFARSLHSRPRPGKRGRPPRSDEPSANC